MAPIFDIDAATTTTTTVTLTAGGEVVEWTEGTPVTADGTYELVVVATDAAGNEASESVTFTIDTTAPVVEITDVVDGQSYNTAVTPVVTFGDDAVSTSITLDGVDWTPAELTADGTYALVYTASDGVYASFLRCDEGG